MQRSLTNWDVEAFDLCTNKNRRPIEEIWRKDEEEADLKTPHAMKRKRVNLFPIFGKEINL
jgi:hypothetical protein